VIIVEMRIAYLSLAVVALVASVQLWGENLWYRMWMHQVYRTHHHASLVPELQRLEAMPPEILEMALRVEHGASGCITLEASADAYGAMRGDEGPCFWFHLRDTPVAQEALAVRAWVQQQARRFDARATHFDFSMWHAFILRYAGERGSFGWHYDAEDAGDFRVLYCLQRTPGAGEMQYIAADGEVVTVPLEPGEGYAFRGSQTFHGVSSNALPTDRRVMLGFHFTNEPGKRSLNLCYAGALAGFKPLSTLRVILKEIAVP
jgi:hypothetical protein